MRKGWEMNDQGFGKIGNCRSDMEVRRPENAVPYTIERDGRFAPIE